MEALEQDDEGKPRRMAYRLPIGR